MTMRATNLAALICAIALGVGDVARAADEAPAEDAATEGAAAETESKLPPIPDTSGLAPPGGFVRNAMRQMEMAAIKDNLAALSGDVVALQRLTRKYQRLNDNAQTEVARIYAKNLYVQLTLFAGYEDNPDLATNAATVRAALEAMPVLEEMKLAARAYDRALRSQNLTDEVDARTIYDSTLIRYRDAKAPLPEALTDQLPIFPDDPLDKAGADTEGD